MGSGSVFCLTASVGACLHIGNQHAVKPTGVCTSGHLQSVATPPLNGQSGLVPILAPLARTLAHRRGYV